MLLNNWLPRATTFPSLHFLSFLPNLYLTFRDPREEIESFSFDSPYSFSRYHPPSLARLQGSPKSPPSPIPNETDQFQHTIANSRI
ncbi:hypothetical protein VN97_g8709 [Penicillium thymicola]|uniref:Uncharacterized protein n=1 Tax=Penicillium thymicola TaxID=293382 RepID=A0AAI9TCK4_PENTH|nr:hypothetical protein VN97_g8709 [Penicillium thymicola]